MKKTGTTVLIFVLSIISAFANLNAQTADLTIKISGMEVEKGVIQLGLYNNDHSFPKENQEFMVIRFDADSSLVIYTIHDLPHGDYAIAFYHDVNDDGEINKNWLGIPKEAFGFSNNVRVRFSAPSFAKTKFNLREDHEILMSLNK